MTPPISGAASGRLDAASVDIDTISKTFGSNKKETTVLSGVSVSVPRGQITSILGESGCGKTTLLRIVAGLEMATSGRIRIDNRDVTDVAAAKRGVAMVFQNYGLYPSKSVEKNIEFPLKLAAVPRAERRERAAAVARLMHIDGILDRLPSQLSGGQRQRVGICRALVRNPRILLMDEPLSNLDAQLRIEMRSELVALQRRIGSTMLYVTHDQIEAMTMSDRIVLMRDGLVEQTGTPLEVFTMPATRYVASFLGNMNLITGAVTADQLVWSAGGRAALKALHPQTGRSVQLGVRPEHVIAQATGSAETDGAFAFIAHGAVTTTELLGTDRVLHVRVGDQTIRARVDASAPVPSEVRLAALPEHLHYFSPETGHRIEL